MGGARARSSKMAAAAAAAVAAVAATAPDARRQPSHPLRLPRGSKPPSSPAQSPSHSGCVKERVASRGLHLQLTRLPLGASVGSVRCCFLEDGGCSASTPPPQVIYLALVSFLDLRGGELLPPPAEAFDYMNQ